MGDKIHMTENASRMDNKIKGSLVLLMAAACGIIVANLYYAQPLLPDVPMDTR